MLSCLGYEASQADDQDFIKDFFLLGVKHLGDSLKDSHIGGHQACLTEIMTSEIQC